MNYYTSTISVPSLEIIFTSLLLVIVGNIFWQQYKQTRATGLLLFAWGCIFTAVGWVIVLVTAIGVPK